MSDVDGGDRPHGEAKPTSEAPEDAGTPEGAENDAGRVSSEDPATALTAERDALQAEVADLKDKLLRAVAETENLRRRTEREKADIRKFAAADFARDLLSVPDNLQRALNAVPPEAREANPDLAQLLEGVELTERELLAQFEKHGIKTVHPQGEKLDPNLHQAMVQIDDDSVEPGTIVQVMQIGYVMHERLLRPAMVGVAKGGAKANAPAGEDPPDGEAAGQNVDTKA
jgi:molecular chaperone GrpE